MNRSFSSLSEQEVLAVAIDVEKNNAERLQVLSDDYIDYSKELHSFFSELRDEELEHLRLLETMWKEKFGDRPKPAVQEMEIREVIEAVDVEHGEHMVFDDIELGDAIRMVNRAETAARKFYQQAASSVKEDNLRKLFLELAELENSHVEKLETLRSSMNRSQ